MIRFVSWFAALAAIVLFVLALIASTTAGLTLFTVLWQVWISAGLLSTVVALFLRPVLAETPQQAAPPA